eukprot:1838750-Rhodomonas_salina.2
MSGCYGLFQYHTRSFRRPGISLRACYAISGTDLAISSTDMAMPGTDMATLLRTLHCAIPVAVLRARMVVP